MSMSIVFHHKGHTNRTSVKSFDTFEALDAFDDFDPCDPRRTLFNFFFASTCHTKKKMHYINNFYFCHN